jgi:hypothetical protein
VGVAVEEVEVRVLLIELVCELDVKEFVVREVVTVDDEDEDDIVVTVTVFEAEALLELEAPPRPGIESGPGTYLVRS